MNHSIDLGDHLKMKNIRKRLKKNLKRERLQNQKMNQWENIKMGILKRAPRKAVQSRKR